MTAMNSSGRLSTHVLDTARGKPAAGVRIILYRLEPPELNPSEDAAAPQGSDLSPNPAADSGTWPRRALCDLRTNQDGRTDTPLLSGAALTVGSYELVFFAGEYLRQTGHSGAAADASAQDAAASGLLFLDQIPIRFGISDASAHYHVPLLISPFAYSTYRGS